MRQPRDFLLYLEDILQEADRVGQFVLDMTYASFSADEKTQYAVVRALEIIGEATKNIPDHIRTDYPQVPWRSMAGMRDKLVHDYAGVVWEVVWKTAQEDIPALRHSIQRILDDFTD